MILTRSKMVAILGLLLGSSLVGPVQANPFEGTTYLKVDAGGVLLQNTPIEIFGYDLKFAAGYRVDLAGGYRLTDWLAAELETGVACNKLEQIGPLDIRSTDTSFYQVPLLANLVCTVPLRSRFKPYVGAGIGPVFSWLDGNTGHDNDITFGFQGCAGMNWEFNDRWALGAVYKFLGTSDHTIALGGVSALDLGKTFSHSFSLSLALKF